MYTGKQSPNVYLQSTNSPIYTATIADCTIGFHTNNIDLRCVTDLDDLGIISTDDSLKG
jgi:hypothetical protein